MKKGRRRKGVGLSLKSRRFLERWNVENSLTAGLPVLAVGATYYAADSVLKLAFIRDEEGRICVGLAEDRGGTWEILDCRPYSARTLAYAQRRLKRVGRRRDLSEGDWDSDPD